MRRFNFIHGWFFIFWILEIGLFEMILTLLITEDRKKDEWCILDYKYFAMNLEYVRYAILLWIDDWYNWYVNKFCIENDLYMIFRLYKWMIIVIYIWWDDMGCSWFEFCMFIIDCCLIILDIMWWGYRCELDWTIDIVTLMWLWFGDICCLIIIALLFRWIFVKKYMDLFICIFYEMGFLYYIWLYFLWFEWRYELIYLLRYWLVMNDDLTAFIWSPYVQWWLRCIVFNFLKSYCLFIYLLIENMMFAFD